MSPISMEYHSLALFALVALFSISPSSALFGSRGEPNDWAFELLPDKHDWTPEKLMQDLSKGYQPKYTDQYRREFGRQEIYGTVYSWLSRTQDKKRPNTIFNKYSVQDLLDLNLIYNKEATLQEYDRRKQMCEEFTPGEVDEEEWRLESRFRQSDEAKLLNQKYFLSKYCWFTFSVFRFGAMENLDKQVKSKLTKKDKENFDNFHKSLRNHFGDPRSKGLEMDEIIEDHIKSYDKKELTEVKASCLKLDQIADTFRLKEFHETKAGEMFGYCKRIQAV